MPDTRASSGCEAVFRSTPTAFTQSSTTASSECASLPSATSCWYCPTPMDLGSILTSSASGSCSRRAMDTAPRSETSRPGSSSGRRPRRSRPSAGLGHHHLGQLELRVALDQVGGQPVGLPRGGAVADGDELGVVLLREPRQGVDGLVPAALRLVRVDGGGVEHLAGGVGDRDLDAGAEARVQADRGPRAGRGGQQQVAQVGGEHLDRLVLGRLPQPDPDVDAQVHQDAGAPGPVHRGGCSHWSAGRLSSRMPNRSAMRCLELRVLGPGLQGEVEDLLLLAAEQGQDAVRGQPRERLAELEVVGELRALALLALADPGGQRAAGGHRLAQLAEQVRVLGEPLDQDGARAVQGGGRVRDALVGVDEAAASAAGRGTGRRAAGRPAAPGRPRGRSAPWCGASACRAGRGLPAGPWRRRRGSGLRARRSACPGRRSP